MTLDTDKLKSKLGAFSNQAPFIMSHAINKTMAATRANQVKEIPNYLDKSNSFTRRAPKYTRSTKKDLTAQLFFNMRTHGYMRAVLEGAEVKPKPGSKRLVSPMKPAQTQSGRMKNYGVGKGKSSYIAQKLNQKTKGGQSKFFIGIPKHKTGDKYLGLWERMAFRRVTRKKGAKPVSHRLRMHVSFHQTRRFDKQKFPSGKIGAAFFLNRIGRQIRVSARKALRTIK